MTIGRLILMLGVTGTLVLWGSPDAAEPPGPLSPADSQASFEVVPGHVVELVAAEPLVFDPVAIC